MSENFNIAIGPFGSVFCPKTEWRSTYTTYMVKHGIKSLTLSYTSGFSSENLDFVKDLPWLEMLRLVYYDWKDISPVQDLHLLRHLEIRTRPEKTALDFSNLPYLEYLYLQWRPSVRNLDSLSNLRSLEIVDYSKKEMSEIASLVGLQSLKLASGQIETLRELRTLENIETLGLYHMRNLHDLSGVECLKGLEILEIETCTRVQSLVPLRNLNKLRKLAVANCGNIDSIEPINLLKKLEVLEMYESTNICDGDLSPLKGLPALRELRLKSRKHYSPPRSSFVGG